MQALINSKEKQLLLTWREYVVRTKETLYKILE